MSKSLWKNTLPPYGMMPTLASPNLNAPPHWRGETPFKDWFDGQVTQIQNLLWPVCDEPNKSWTGEAAATMLELTKADLQLLRDLQGSQTGHPLEVQPDVTGRHLACPTHGAFFWTEDFSGLAKPPIEANRVFAMYRPQASADLIEVQSSAEIGAQTRAKVTLGMIYSFKEKLQRPRPYQAAMWLGEKTGFSHQGAKSALHPAMISGHCIQGLGSIMAFSERLLLGQHELPQGDWQALARYYTDFGDRRVFAGVHYPSDNLSSWIVAMSLCDKVVDSRVVAETRKRLSKAISGSIIYGEIKKRAKGESPYKPAWQHLQSLLDNQD